MEFKDLLKVLEEYYAKATEVSVVRHKWCEDELKIKSGKLSIQCDSRQTMTSLQDSITRELNYIFSFYVDHDTTNFKEVKNDVDNFIESANMWLDCFEENKGE